MIKAPTRLTIRAFLSWLQPLSCQNARCVSNVAAAASLDTREPPQIRISGMHDPPAVKIPYTERGKPAALTNEAVRARRSALFEEEKARQIQAVTRVEKIEVRHRGQPEDVTLIMNKSLSTPLHCAQHIGELLIQRSALALVDGKPWDMHRPLENDCSLEFMHFFQDDPHEANLAFFRTGSLILSYVMERAFKDDFFVQAHSWPYQDILSGSFLCDVDLSMPDWNPREDELRCLTLIFSKLRSRKLPIERLEISADLAMEMFEHNKYKKDQIPVIAEKSPTKDRVLVYRVDDHVEISSGPMISNTGLIGRHQITAVYPIDGHGYGRLFRVQGIALPAAQPLNYFAWNILVNRARQFNASPVPSRDD